MIVLVGESGSASGRRTRSVCDRRFPGRRSWPARGHAAAAVGWSRRRVRHVERDAACRTGTAGSSRRVRRVGHVERVGQQRPRVDTRGRGPTPVSSSCASVQVLRAFCRRYHASGAWSIESWPARDRDGAHPDRQPLRVLGRLGVLPDHPAQRSRDRRSSRSTWSWQAVALGDHQPVADVRRRTAAESRATTGRAVRVEDPCLGSVQLARGGACGARERAGRCGVVGHARVLARGWWTGQISNAGVPNVWSSASLRDTR